MVSKLTPDTDGERRIFGDSLVLNMREFLDTFKSRNIADDADLEKLVEDTKALLPALIPTFSGRRARSRKRFRPECPR